MMYLLVICHNKMATTYAVTIGLGCVFVVYIIVYFILLARLRNMNYKIESQILVIYG